MMPLQIKIYCIIYWFANIFLSLTIIISHMVLLDLGQDIVRYLQTLLGSYVSMQYNTDK